MNPRHVVGFALGVVMVIALLGRAQDAPDQPPGTEVMARGLVHEAFAEPISDQPTQGTVVAKEPPAPIDELPPDEKPEGANVQWIPGYWTWDADSSNFLWVSGFWRDIPPGQQWVPGHWQETDQGFVWTSGFWAPDNVQQVQYLPPPPPTVEAGPSTPAPAADSTYVGGSWIYAGTTYRWRPGFWIPYRPGWVWIPAHYVWTPIGVVFVNGYWDHPLELRGLLFAPVRFNLAVWQPLRRPFIPSFCISSDFLIGALFVGPHTRHYYFGDYFEPRYAQRGFVAWTDYHPRRGMFDPNFAYYRHLHAAEPGWEKSLRTLYVDRRAGTVPRPPRTLVQQVQVVKNITINKTSNTVVNNNINLTHIQNVTALTSLKDVHKVAATGLGGLTPGKVSQGTAHTVKLQAVPKEERVRVQNSVNQVRETSVQRHETEAKILGGGNVPVKHTDPARTVKLPLANKPATPVVPPTKAPPPQRVAPPPPTAPAHVEHAVPKYEPRPPVQPAKKIEKKIEKKAEKK
jgi:hypothetical protein